MAKRMMDLALSEVEDVQVGNGDFGIVESTAQHQRQLILNNKGDFKQFPTVCVGAFNYLHDEHVRNLARAISTEFARDGMDVKEVKVEKNGAISSNASYR